MMLVPLSPEQLREALDGETPGGAAEGWRLLREDVRMLAPPLDREFERELYARLTGPARSATEAIPQTGRRPAGPPVQTREGPVGRLAGAIRAHGAAAVLASGAAAALCAVLVALLAGGVFGGGSHRHQLVPESRVAEGPVFAASGSNAAAAAPEVPSAGASEAAASAPARRLQEKAASITLAAVTGQVQAVADGVSRLASSEGGYVVNSQVNVESQGKGEATLTLSVPSAHLERSLAALGRLAPVRAQSNSLQDITSSYESAKRALGDAVAERAGLLRALARATTPGEIESLRRRLSLAGATISRESAALQSVSRRAANSRVEVSVLSAAGSGEERSSTLSRGLHDAGHVLAVVLVGLLIALAVLVPLALVALLGTFASRRWQRRRRERVLGER